MIDLLLALLFALLSALSPAPAPETERPAFETRPPITIPAPAVEELGPAPTVAAPVAEDDYPANCSQSTVCPPMSSLLPAPNSGGLATDPNGEIYQLTLEHGYVSTGQCVHMSPCYDGHNGPYLPEN